MTPSCAVSGHETGQYRIPLIDLSGWQKIHAAHLALHEKNLPPSAPPQESKTMEPLTLNLKQRKIIPTTKPDTIQKSRPEPEAFRGLMLKRPFVEKSPRVPKGPPKPRQPKLEKAITQEPLQKIEAPEPEQFDKSQADIYAMGFNERTAYNAKLYDHRQAQCRTLAKAQSDAPLSKAQATDDFYKSLQPLAATLSVTEYNKLSPFQRRAVMCGLSPYLTDVSYELMTDEEMTQHAAKLKREQYGIPEPVTR
jgi:hypothetical protein